MLLLFVIVAKKRKPRALLENDVHLHFFTESPYNMVIILQVSKIAFVKTENIEKEIHISQNLAKILTEKCVFLKKVFYTVFLKLPRRK